MSMFEILNPGIRHGEARYGGYADVEKGCFCFISGLDTDGYKILECPTSSAGAKIAFYPINKLNYKPEDSDSDLSTITNGDTIVYYEGGEYITDYISTCACHAMYGPAVNNNVYGMAICTDRAGKVALAAHTASGGAVPFSVTFADFVATANTMIDNVMYLTGIAISYVDVTTTTGYLRFRLNQVSPRVNIRTTTALATP